MVSIASDFRAKKKKKKQYGEYRLFVSQMPLPWGRVRVTNPHLLSDQVGRDIDRCIINT